MPLTLTVVDGTRRCHKNTNDRRVEYDITFDTAGSAGWALAYTDVGFAREIRSIEEIGGDNGYLFKWDKTNGKLFAYEGAGAGVPLAKIGDGDLNAAVVRFRIQGT